MTEHGKRIGGMNSLGRLIPGILLAVVATVIAMLVNSQWSTLSAILVAIVLGIIARNVGVIPQSADEGLAFVGKTILRGGVVLLGFQLSVPVILSLGVGPILVILATVSVTFLSALGIGRLLNLGSIATILTGTGTCICGAAAVAAMSGTLAPHAKALEAADRQREATTPAGGMRLVQLKLDEAIAAAVGGVTVFGLLAMVILPLLSNAFGFTPLQSGVWLGSSIHEVGQVVAAGGLMTKEIQSIAVVTKLGRVLLLAPLVLIVSMTLGKWSEKNAAVDHGARTDAKKPPLVPLFVVGFVVMMLIRSFVGIEDTHVVASTIKLISTIMLTAAMFAMGAGVRVRTLISTGGRALVLGAAVSVIAAIVSGVGAALL